MLDPGVVQQHGGSLPAQVLRQPGHALLQLLTGTAGSSLQVDLKRSLKITTRTKRTEPLCGRDPEGFLPLG